MRVGQRRMPARRRVAGAGGTAERARPHADAAAKRSVCQSLSPSQKSIMVSRFA